MNKNIVEIIDSLIELAPNSKVLQVSLFKDDFEKLKKDLESETSESISFGDFQKINYENKENFFTIKRMESSIVFSLK